VYLIDDTIAAVGSAAGAGGRGVVRLSGATALDCVSLIFTPNPPYSDETSAPPRGRRRGRIALTETIGGEAQRYVFRAPHSYTGEDMVELHIPGAPALVQMVLERILARGVRLAQPGEFTARAFFNGRLDLSQAEAVAEIINARSDAQLRAAGRLLDGALTVACRNLTERLADLLALVETGIDFSEEEIEIITPEQFYEQVRGLERDLDRLLRESTSWDRLDQLPRVVVAGPANAGKSCLVNALLDMDRSIVNSMAGTTRDLLTAPLALEHGECMLVDTAGLGPVNDRLADQTQSLTRQAIKTADLIMWVYDITSNAPELEGMIRNGFARLGKVIWVGNKVDLVGIDTGLAARREGMMAGHSITVSALRGDNLDQLKILIDHTLQVDQADSTEGSLALTARQRQALVDARQSLVHALQEPGGAHQPELWALELRESLDHLGSISGHIVPEEVLTRIFSRFCIGK
jgi:tRNA modification GTPase